MREFFHTGCHAVPLLELETQTVNSYCLKEMKWFLEVIWLHQDQLWATMRRQSHSLDLNPLLGDVLTSCLLKTPENQRFSGVFREYKTGTFARNGLITAYYLFPPQGRQDLCKDVGFQRPVERISGF